MFINDMKDLNCGVSPDGKHGGFCAYIHLGWDKNGKRIRPKGHGRTEDEAIAKLEKKLQEMGYIQPDPDAPKLAIRINKFTPIPDFVREYRVNFIMEQVKLYEEYGQYVKRSSKKNERKGFTSRTAENYLYALKPFEDYFYNNTLGELNTSAINQFFRAQESKKNKAGEYLYAQTSLNRIEFAVCGMFKRAVDNDWIAENPFNSVKYLSPASRKETEKIEGLTPEELKEFLREIKEYPVIYSPIMLMLNTGVRTQEVLALKWKDIDFVNGRIHIQQAVTVKVEFDDDGKIKKRQSIVSKPKTEKSARTIGLTPEAQKILMDWKQIAPSVSKTKLGPDDFVFGYEKKPNFTYNAFRDRINDYLGRVNGDIDKMRLHRFRHTVATILASRGQEVLQVMRQLGITQENTLQRYIDQKANDQMISSNTQAISQGLSNMIGQGSTDGEKPDLQEILKQAESITDDRAKEVIKYLMKLIQDNEK